MFKRATALTLFFMMLSLSLVTLKVFWVTGRDRDSHQKILEYLQPSRADNRGTTHRNRVTKDLWMQQKEEVYQYKIISQDSALHLNQLRATDTRVTEEMKQAQCLMQQKLYYVDEFGKEVKYGSSNKTFPMQQVCRVCVDSGTYHYFTKNFEGDVGHLEIYELSGHELPQDLSGGKKIMEGDCDHISFYFIETIPNLKVKNLVASIYGERDK